MAEIIPEHAWHDLARRIDTLLANHGMLRAPLKAPHPPFDASPAEAMAHYGGPGPLFALWTTCADVAALRRAWTGRGTPAVETPVIRPEPVRTAEEAPYA